MDQVNAHLSQYSGAVYRDWMTSGFPSGRPRPVARRTSQPLNTPIHQVGRSSESAPSIDLVDQNVPKDGQDGATEWLPATFTDRVLPSPAPSDDTPYIMSISSTRPQSQDQQPPQSQRHPDLDGMGTRPVTHDQSPRDYGNQTTRQTARTAETTPGKRPAEFEDTSQPKRRATDFGPLTPAQSASPRAAPIDNPAARLTWKKLIHLLDARLVSLRMQGQDCFITGNRLRLLREACDLEDIVYLAMHQVFCVGSILKLKTPACPAIPGIAVLCQLLLNNENLDRESLEWFYTFPSSFPIAPDSYLWEYNQAQTRLKLLEQSWSVFQSHFIAQKLPPTDKDLVKMLKVTSPILQRIIHRCICRAFWPPSPEDHCLQGCFDLFTRYQIANRRLRAAHQLTDDERNLALANNYWNQTQEYQERWYQHQCHVQSAFSQNVAQQRPTSAANQTQRRRSSLAAPTIVPSNDTMRSIVPGSIPVVTSGSSQYPTFATTSQPRFQQFTGMATRDNPTHVNHFQSLAQPGQVATSPTSSTSNTPDNAINPPPQRRGRPPLHRISLSTENMQMGSPLPSGHSNASPRQSTQLSQQGFGPPLRTVSQPQRQNTVLTPPFQSQQRFIGQRIPFQYQQQQDPRAIPYNAPQVQPHPPVASLFRVIDYTGTPLHQITSTLHQAHLEESPIVISIEGRTPEDKDTKYLHYLDSFALPPFLLKPQDRNRKCTFTISPPSYNLLAIPPKVNDATQPPLKPGSQTYRLRCVKVPLDPPLDKTGSFWAVQDTHWPPFIVLMLNDRHLDIRRKEVHGKDHYIEVSDAIVEGDNRLSVSLLRSAKSPTKDMPTYAIAIETLRIKSTAAARDELGHLSAALTRTAMLARLQTSDPDIEILSGATMRLSLIDPISLKLIASPVRGESCKHFECFDLEAFLATRHDSASPQCARPEAFRCPICGADARPKVLLKDEWMAGVLAMYGETGTERGVKGVVVDDRGEWRFEEEKAEAGAGKGSGKVKMEEGEEHGGGGAEFIVLDE